jgi:hypothetical protein
MNYGEIRTQFKAILNRRDCSNTLADTFLNQSLQRCTRELRTPAQEAQTTLTVADPFTGFPVPADIIQTIAMMAQISGGQQRKIEYYPLARFLELDNTGPSQPAYYTRIGNAFQFRPTPAVDTEITLYYYGEFEQFADDADETVLSLIAPDLLIYGALAYAADYFMDDRGQAFEGRYVQIAQALQDQAYDLEAHDAAVSPAYNTPY